MTEEVKKRIEDINNGIVPEGYKKTRTGIFPADWDEVVIEELFYKVMERNNGQFDKTKWISVAKMYYQEPEKVTSNNIDTRTYVMRKGDMAFEGHPNKDFLFGRFVVNDIGDGIISELFPIYRHKDEYVSEYWKYAIQYESVMARIYSRCITISGASANKINDDEFLKEKLCVPSLNEQKTIGGILLAQDELITIQERKVEELKNLKKAYLTKMFPQKGSKYPEIRFKGFTDAWEQRKVGDISTITAGGTPSTKEISYWEPKEIPWLASGEVNKKYIYDTEEMISNEGLKNSSAKWVNEGSILIALAGQGKTRGTAAITRIPITTNQSIAAIKFDNFLDSDYAFHNLDSRYDELRTISSGDGARGGLNKQLLSDLEIIFPKIDEQIKIGQFFTNLDNLVTLHQRKLEAEKKKKKALMQLLLTGKVRFKV